MEENASKVKNFRDLGVCEQLVEACEGRGWLIPSKIQAEAIPHALQGRDIIGLAETGSGKTGAFALPIIQALLEKPHPFFACVLSPTRELALQISDEFKALGAGIGLKSSVLFGGVDMMEQAKALAKRPHIVVATPGRLLDHLSNTKGFSLKMIKYLVLDEADRLLSMEFEKVIDDILKALPRDRRTYLFSATMTKKVTKLQRACLKNPVKVEASAKYTTVDTCEQKFCLVPDKYKDCYLVNILNDKTGSTVMIFRRKCEATRYLALFLRELGFNAIPINGQMTQPKRLGALNLFKSGERDILVCTDVASRGLDIPAVDLVINYDIPTNPKDYFHRIGRTARAGRSGLAVSLVNQYETGYYLQIEKLLNKKLPQIPYEQDKAMALLERVSEARRRANMASEESGGKRRRRHADNDEEEDEEGGSSYMSRKKAKKSRRR